MASAPVCNNAPPAVIDQPTAKGMPAIPEATDLPSLIAAVGILRRIVQQMINSPGFPGGLSGFKVKTDKPRGFREIKKYRVTKKTRVFNPNDHSQYVDVEQIVGMVMQDPLTGQVWQWQQ